MVGLQYVKHRMRRRIVDIRVDTYRMFPLITSCAWAYAYMVLVGMVRREA